MIFVDSSNDDFLLYNWLISNVKDQPQIWPNEPSDILGKVPWAYEKNGA